MNNIFNKISQYLLLLMNIALALIGAILCFVLFVEAWHIIKISINFLEDTNYSYKNIVEEIIYFFLYFELVALIVKYFKNNFHFPLRYFIYIGITAVIRLIIVDHDVSKNVLLWGTTIFLLSCSLAIVNKFVKHD